MMEMGLDGTEYKVDFSADNVTLNNECTKVNIEYEHLSGDFSVKYRVNDPFC